MKTSTIATVTDEQISKCHRILDEQTFDTFYQVESENDCTKLYEVRYNTEKKALTCTCKAGQNGVPCKHRRWAMAHADEYNALVQSAREYEETGRAAWLKEVEEFEQERRDFEHEENYRRMLQAPLNNRNRGFSILR